MDKWVRINKGNELNKEMERSPLPAMCSYVARPAFFVGSCMISVGCADASIGSEPVFWQVEVSFGSRLPCLFPALCPLSRARAS